MAAVEVDHVAVEQRLLDDALRPGAAVLDAGCGRTTRLRFYRDRIERLVGVDADEPAGRENPSVDEFVHANLDERLPFDDASFDLVYANFVVEHLDDPAGAFADWRRLLRPDGRVVIVTSNRASPAMALGARLPNRVRLGIKRRGAGAAEKDVYPTRYRANTPAALARGHRGGRSRAGRGRARRHVAPVRGARPGRSRGAPVAGADAAREAPVDDRRLVSGANVRILLATRAANQAPSTLAAVL